MGIDKEIEWMDKIQKNHESPFIENDPIYSVYAMISRVEGTSGSITLQAGTPSTLGQILTYNSSSSTYSCVITNVAE